MKTRNKTSELVKFRRLPAPPNCSLHAVAVAEEGLDVSDAEVEYYLRLWDRRVTQIRFERYRGQTLPVLVFEDGLTAGVYCDPECNAPGHLAMHWNVD